MCLSNKFLWDEVISPVPCDPHVYPDLMFWNICIHTAQNQIK